MSNQIIVFHGYDANNHEDLWVTDGTASGTSELSVAGTNSSRGLSPYYLTSFHGKVLFEGDDSSGNWGLWVTDGTAGGTSELSIAGAYSGGIFNFTSYPYPDFTAFGSELMFTGRDTTGNFGLWVTDGTASGTSELSSTSGLSPADLTVLGNKVLFKGHTNSFNGRYGLWVSDGTAAGTSEISVAGAYKGGGPYPGGLFVSVGPNFFALGSKLLFQGADTAAHNQLWVTDGTAAGTSELLPTGAYSGGLLANGYTYFSKLGGKVLFDGYDAAGNDGLWVTNGTTSGTSELSVAGVYSGGIFQGTIFPSFTVLGSEVLFEGKNAAGGIGLWVTDGTASGTSELSVAGARGSGLFDPTGFAIQVLGNKALFTGVDASGNNGFWVTDGTASGTSELTVAGAYSGGLNAGGFTVFGSELMFSGYDVNHKLGLWLTDGTASGTSEITVPGNGGMYYPAMITRPGGEFLVNTQTAGNQLLPRTGALTGGGFVITWTDTSGTLGDSSGTSIKARMFDASGNAVGSEFLVNSQTAGPQDSSVVTGLAGGGFVIVWHDYSGTLGGSTNGSIKAQMFDAAGNETGGEILVSSDTAGGQSWPSVTALANGGFVVSFDDGSGALGELNHSVVAQVFDASGNKVGDEFVVSAANADWQGLSTLTGLANGDFVATWEDEAADGSYSIEGQVFDQNGAKIGAAFQVNTSAASGTMSTPKVAALANGGFVATWWGANGAEAQLFDSAGNKVGVEFAAGPTNFTSTASEALTLSSTTDGGFIVAWTDYSNTLGDTSESGIAAQRFDASGNKIGAQFLANTQTAGAQWRPSIIGLTDGGYAVSWIDASGTLGDSSGTSIKAAVFAANPAVTTIAAGSTLEINAASAAPVAFAPATAPLTGGTLQLDHSASFNGEIIGFTGTDKIDLRDIAYGAGTTLGYSANPDNSGGILTVSDGTTTAALALLGQYSAGMFTLSSDGHGGITVVDPPISSQAQTIAAAHQS
jgi:ELWxxDGT repeat protein